jgi:hypothetical protein
VVIIEDTSELQCALPNYVALRASRVANEAKLLETALRLIPKRIVVGEVRSGEPARVLLEAGVPDTVAVSPRFTRVMPCLGCGSWKVLWEVTMAWCANGSPPLSGL